MSVCDKNRGKENVSWEQVRESCLAMTSCLTKKVLPARWWVCLCFLICSSFPASSCSQTIQGNSRCLPIHPDPPLNRRSLSYHSTNCIWDLFQLASSFNLFLLTFDNHFSNILIWGLRISGLIKDTISVSHFPCNFRVISDRRGYKCLYSAILKIKSWLRVLKQYKWASRAEDIRVMEEA